MICVVCVCGDMCGGVCGNMCGDMCGVCGGRGK